MPTYTDVVERSSATSYAENALVNGGFRYFFTTNPAAATAMADDAYGPEGWYGLTQTDTVNVERSAGYGAGRYAVKLTQSQAAAQRMGLAQIIEASPSIAYRSRAVRFQCYIKCSAAQAINCAIVEHTGTADSVTSDIVGDWTSTDYTDGASKFFVDASLLPVNSATVTPGAATWTALSVTGTVSANCNNIIVAVWTSATAAQNVTLEISQAGFYAGTAAQTWTPYPEAIEQALCERYCEKSLDPDVIAGTATAVGAAMVYINTNTIADQQYIAGVRFRTAKFAIPTVSVYGCFSGATAGTVASNNANLACGTTINMGTTGFKVYNNSAGTITTDNNLVQFHYVATARL